MSDHDKDVSSPLLNDQEFAALMISEYDAHSKATAYSFSRGFRHFGATAMAAGLSFVLLVPNQHVNDLHAEFSSSLSSEHTPLRAGTRTKSGGSAVTPLPNIESEFMLSEHLTDTIEPQDVKVFEKELSIQVKSTTQERLRVEVYRSGVLRERRTLDPLELPVEQYQELRMEGRILTVPLLHRQSLLVCVKPESAPQAPHVLDRDSMRERAQQYSSQCFFHE